MPETKTAAELRLVPAGTVVEASGDGPSLSVPPDGARVFVIELTISETIEQESLELSLWGSADGQNWGSMPLLKLPQRFYRGPAQMVLDLSQRPEVTHLRTRWDLNRWGRGRPVPHFRFSVTARPVG